MLRSHEDKPLKNWHLLTLGVIFLVFLVVRWTLPAATPKRAAPPQPEKAVVTVGSSTFPALIANTPDLAYRGLSDRPSLGTFGGMLFVFPTTATRTFVMRDMLFPLDIVWITDGVISDMSEMLPLEPTAPESDLTLYTGKEPVQMVLEVASGTVRQNGWRLGDSVTVQY